MSADSWTLVAIVAVALLLMTLAAIAEGSATLISRQRLRQSAVPRDRNVAALLDPRRSLISALQLVQVIAVVISASLLTVIVASEGIGSAAAIAIVAVTLLFLVLGQAIPRAITRTHPPTADGFVLPLARALAFLVRPLTAVADVATHALVRLFGGEHPDTLPAGTEEELLLLSRDAIDDDIIEPEERAMIDNVLQLEETTARDIMVPRVDIAAVSVDAAPREIVDMFTETGHSRLPVYSDSIDHIVGILYAKDLLPYVIGSTRILPLPKLLRPVYVIPESKKIDDLLTELRRARVHIAIVADEYGGTAGLVTIEDILEEIVGEIHDEHDQETTLIERLSDHEIIVDGRIPIEDVEEALNLHLTDDDDPYGTAAGFVHWHLDRLPQPGDKFEAQGLRAEVIDMEGHRLRRLRLTRLDDGEQPGVPPVAAAEPEPIPLPEA